MWWGVAALVAWAVAVLAANLSGVIPAGALAALHGSRLDGGTLNQLRTQVASLQQEAERMRRENNQLVQQIAMGADTTSLIGRRVGALEVSLPKVIEAQSTLQSQLRAQSVDSTVTGGIREGGVLTFEAEGGTVAVQQRPLMIDDGAGIGVDLPMPDPVIGADTDGVALGFAIDPAEAEPAWQELLASAGTLLTGLGPVLTPADGAGRKQIVAGPLPDLVSAADLCGKLEAIAVPCKPAPFSGDPVPLLN
jgi:hypothetical protein